MEAVLAFLGTKLGLAALAGGSVLVGWLGPKVIKPMVSKYIGKAVALGLDPKSKDPRQKQLIKEFVTAGIRLAEYSIPDRGKGKAKKEMVVEMLSKISVIPSGVASALGAIVQEVFDSMDDELKKVK